MKTSELEKKIKSAFEDSADLTDLLSKGAESIYNPRAPSTTKYPYLVFSPIIDIPAIHGDNKEMFHKVTFRIWSVVDARISEANKLLVENVDIAARKILLELGFMRQSTTSTIIDGEKMIISDYVIGITED